MEFKGTKGKWNIERHQHQLCGDYLIIDENDYQLAIADNEYIQDYEKTKANALLISKAPEMLEALKTVISLRDLIDYDESIVNESNIGEASALNQMLKRIDSLIKEATEL